MPIADVNSGWAKGLKMPRRMNTDVADPLAGLLGDRRDDDRRPHLAGVVHRPVDRLHEERSRGGDQGTPQERRRQQRHRFRLVPVEPEVAGDQRPHRQQRQHQPHRDRLRLPGCGEDERDDGRAQEQSGDDEHHEQRPPDPVLPVQRRRHRRQGGGAPGHAVSVSTGSLHQPP
jgi:hypothetical protein